MAQSAYKHENRKGKDIGTRDSGLSSAEEAFRKATEFQQQGDLSQALSLYNQIIERYPGHVKADMAKTLVAGIQKKKINTYWELATEARASCNAEEALKLYKLIIDEFPDSAEAGSARTEIQTASEIRQYWDSALGFQSRGNESKAMELYNHIIERHPQSPEAENAGLLVSLLHQNKVMPTREVTSEVKETNTPAKIISYLMAHKKAISGNRILSPEAMREEMERKKIENLWMQAVALEKDGHVGESAILYRKIIETSTNGYRVRDAKYKLEQVKARSEMFPVDQDAPEQWGLASRGASGIRQKITGIKISASAVLGLAVIVWAAVYYWPAGPSSWVDIVETAKKSVVVVRTATGAGSGFIVSSDGLIYTSAHVVGKEKDVEVRLYSGVLKKAAVTKIGTRPLDIAVLKIDGSYDQYLSLAASDECREGDEIRAIGAPLGLEYFITKGIISHCNVDRDGVRYIQTDTAINAGYSGGPCLNNRGMVIGLSTAMMLGDDTRGLNLILPVTVVKDFMDGKLVSLEEALIKKEEERARDIEQRNSKFYAEVENINKRLQYNADLEFANFKAKLNNLLRTHAVTDDQAKLMMEQVQYAPSGSATLSQWIQSLTLKVAKGEMTEESAIKLIKAQFKL